MELRDGNRIKTEGRGSVRINSLEIKEWQVHDVYYSPNITENLFSVGPMMRNRYKLIFDKDCCQILVRKK